MEGARDATVNCTVELENGAVFTMALTEQGAACFGLRDHTELRAGNRMVTLTDATRYRAKSSDKVKRRARIPRLKPYRLIYRSIGERTVAGEPGGSLRSVEVRTRLVLALEEQLAEKAARKPGKGSRGMAP